MLASSEALYFLTTDVSSRFKGRLVLVTFAIKSNMDLVLWKRTPVLSYNKHYERAYCLCSS